MNGFEQISTAACSVVEAAETTCATEVYQLNDASGHQHDIVSLQVTMNYPAQVKVGHPLQNLMGVKSQDTLRQRTKPEDRHVQG